MKLVRGAYHPHEMEVHKAATQSRIDRTTPSGTHELSISPDNMPPVWLVKHETDTCYDESVRLLVGLVREDADAVEKGAPGPAIGALFGTHNWESANLVIDELVRQGLATKMGEGESGSVWISDAAMKRVVVAQLYGAWYLLRGMRARMLTMARDRHVRRANGPSGPPYSHHVSVRDEVPAVRQSRRGPLSLQSPV